MIRLPFAPLEDCVASRLGRRPTNHELMEILGVVSETMLPRYRNAGLHIWQADEFAVLLNHHPAGIWGYQVWMWALTDGVNEECDSL